jgi:hypothetical protein
MVSVALSLLGTPLRLRYPSLKCVVVVVSVLPSQTPVVKPSKVGWDHRERSWFTSAVRAIVGG